jgi:hypothetical protein
MTATKKEPLRVTANFEVAIDPDWIEYLTVDPDIFGAACGYWLRGVERDAALGWLVWEDDNKCRHGEEPNAAEAVAAWREGKPLPPHWFKLDKDAAIRAWIEGVKKWGVDWYDQVDAEREDVVVQLALLGEIRYG